MINLKTKAKDFLNFIDMLDKKEGYNPHSKTEKGFYIRTMGISILVLLMVFLMLAAYLWNRLL